MHITVDSSVWISALRFGGIPLQALQVAAYSHRIIFCHSIEVEVTRTLLRKFGMPVPSTLALMEDYLRSSIIVNTTGALRGVCRDPNDDVILECACAGPADLIISGDNDLLQLRSYQGIRILNPRSFLDEYTDLKPLE